MAACRDPGALPARLAAAKRALALGHELYVSFNTVHSHVKAIYRKLGVSSRAEALVRANDERLH